MITHDPTNAAFLQSQIERKEHWNAVACRLDNWQGWGSYYHHRLEQILRFLIVPKERVLEIGCALGDLLAMVEPEMGMGIDLSNKMLNRAKLHHPRLAFIQSDAHSIPLDQKSDCIIVSDLLNDLWDVQALFEEIKKLAHPHSRVIINSSPLNALSSSELN
jgi:ubiquinone/menaquinone biosynthesis C-methylase UbiE